jgi:endonuclease YncB( thermonuclease family)
VNYIYDNVEVVRVVDGDTVFLRLKKNYTIDFGFKIIDVFTKETVQEFRLARINAPEKSGATKEAGQQAQDFLVSLLSRSGSISVNSLKTDKYGRYLGEISMVTNGKTVSVNDEMVQAGHAVPYMV